ncbi:hypothetical protein FHZ94_06885 [Listeria monocytogenes]|nr:hypothetical protein [Listeria monocytogenes]EBF5125246.1 hypothetical protein [Listeria monocytogenes]
MAAKKKTETDKRKARQSKARKTVEKILEKEVVVMRNMNFNKTLILYLIRKEKRTADSFFVYRYTPVSQKSN